MVSSIEFIKEYIIRPIKYDGFSVNKLAMFTNLAPIISNWFNDRFEWYFILFSYVIVIVNYIIVLFEYRDSKPILTITEIEVDERNKKIKKVLSRW